MVDFSHTKKRSLLPPQGILCIKIDALLLVALLYYCKTQFSMRMSQGNIPKNARVIILMFQFYNHEQLRTMHISLT